MKFSVPVLSFFSALALSASLIAPASADIPGQHPYYVHALGDLHFAQELINRGDYRPGVDAAEDAALNDISHAYFEIKRAGIDDGKDVEARDFDHGLDRHGRLHKAMECLMRARADVSREEDDPAAVGLKDHAIHHIADAMDHVRHAMQDASRM